MRNTPQRSRKDIAAHYDLGNELFELMLDPTLMYSCGLFEHRDATLEEASIAKLEMVCDKLELGPRDHVARDRHRLGRVRRPRRDDPRLPRDDDDDLARAARRSRSSAIAEAGVERPRRRSCLDDYRDLRGRYDKLVSIEMIEAVGWQDFGTFFERCSDLLAPDGPMLLQAITIDDRAYAVEKASRTFIRTYVFPGGCLPSLEVISKCIAKRTDMRTIHLEDLTPHYAETLRRWRENFEAATDELAALGYDERFRRLWRMYLSYCEAGFAERRIGVVQTVLAKPLAGVDVLAEAPRARSRGRRLNIRAADRVEQERRPARGELRDREPAARPERCGRRPRPRRAPSPPTRPARPCPSPTCPCGGRRPPRWRRACRC